MFERGINEKFGDDVGSNARYAFTLFLTNISNLYRMFGLYAMLSFMLYEFPAVMLIFAGSPE